MERVAQVVRLRDEHRVQERAGRVQPARVRVALPRDREHARRELEDRARPAVSLVLRAEVRHDEHARELPDRLPEPLGAARSLHVQRFAQHGGRLRSVQQQDARDAMGVGRERRLLEVVGRCRRVDRGRVNRAGDRNDLRPRTNSPYQASPRRGSSSFQRHTRSMSGPQSPSPSDGVRSVVACHRLGSSTPAFGNSRANPTSSMNRAARSMRAIGRPDCHHRFARASSRSSAIGGSMPSNARQDVGGNSTTRPSSETEVPDVDERRFHAERREGGADLAPMIRPVVQRLREPDADGRVGLGPVVAVPFQDGVRVGIVRQDRRPGGAVALHRGPELREVHVVLGRRCGGLPAAEDEQVVGVGSDGVAHRVDDGSVGPRDGGLQLRRIQREARHRSAVSVAHTWCANASSIGCLLMRTR